MNHKTQTDGDDEGPGRHAEGHPSVVSARRSVGWEPVGNCVQAVVMRLQTLLPRVKVTGPGRETEGKTHRDRL